MARPARFVLGSDCVKLGRRNVFVLLLLALKPLNGDCTAARNPILLGKFIAEGLGMLVELIRFNLYCIRMLKSVSYQK